MTIYLLIDVVVGFFFCTLVVLALVDGGYKKHQNRLFAALSICLLAWMVSNQISTSTSTPELVAVSANYILFSSSLAATLLIAKLLVQLVDTASSQRRRLKRLEPLMWLIVLLSATPLVGNGVENQGAVYGVIFGPAISLYAISLVLLLSISGYAIFKGWNSHLAREKSQMRTIGVSFIIAAPLSFALGFLIPFFSGRFEIAQASIAPLAILALGIFHAIVRHGLFDVRLATVRTVGYALTVAVMAGIYVLLAYAMSVIFFGGAVTDGVGLSPASIAIALILAFIFQPIKQFFDSWTNKIFYRGTYSREIFVRDFGKIISYDTDLLLLLKQSSAYIRETLGAEGVFFYVNGRTVFAVNSKSKKRILPTDVDMIGAYYHKNYEFPAVLVSDLVESDQVRRVLKAYQIYMVLPLILQGQPIGYLFIGEHKSRGYTMRDVRVIESIANELAIAVQNSLSVEEIRELNENLQQRVESATKELRESNRQLQRLDEAKTEFISMASHQLRTPLTSIKGYLDMVLQGDLGKVSATQRTVLSEAFLSSERMVTLINDFLNVSRLQTGKFVIDRTEGDLKEVVADQVNMLQVIAKQHDLVIKETVDKDVPQMNIDIDKLRQVIVNFIDNAIYYSKPGTAIRVKLARDKHYVEFTVKDTGIGVPEAEKSKLFTRFFRAQNARRRRPDGTGVGLFLAKKVVMLHGGEIIFESEEGKGSTFGFRLPILSTETD